MSRISPLIFACSIFACTTADPSKPDHNDGGGADDARDEADPAPPSGPCAGLSCGSGRCESPGTIPICKCNPGTWFSFAEKDCVPCTEVTDTIAIEVRGVEVTPVFTYDGEPADAAMKVDPVGAGTIWLQGFNATGELKSGVVNVIQPGKYQMFSHGRVLLGPYKQTRNSFAIGTIDIVASGTYNIELPKLHRNIVQFAGLPTGTQFIRLTHESGQTLEIKKFNQETLGFEESGKASFFGPPGEYSVDFINALPNPFFPRTSGRWTEAENMQPAWGRFQIPEGGSDEVHLVPLDTHELTFILKFRGQDVEIPIYLSSPRGYFIARSLFPSFPRKVSIPKGTYRVIPAGRLNLDGKAYNWGKDLGVIEVTEDKTVELEISASLVTASMTLNGQPFPAAPTWPQPSLAVAYLSADGDAFQNSSHEVNPDGTITFLAQKGVRVRLSPGISNESVPFANSVYSGINSIHVFEQDTVPLAFDLKTSTINLQFVTSPVEANEGQMVYSHGTLAQGFSATKGNQVPYGEWEPSWVLTGRNASYHFPPVTIDKPETQLTYQLPMRKFKASAAFVGENSRIVSTRFSLKGAKARVELAEPQSAKTEVFDDVLLPAGNYEVTTAYPPNVLGCVSVKR